MTDSQKIAHLYRRAGFGLNIRETPDGALNDAINKILASNTQFDELYLEDEERVTAAELLAMNPEQRKEIIQDLAANIKKLNLQWIKIMGKAEGQLREKMSLFWHGHFAVRVRGFAQVESYANTIRQHALGNFRELLMAVSKEPAMLKFLNNVQNKKNSPNENFAREVMELFTLGRGNYTEHDIKEAARAFTGWGINQEDEFELKTFQHDSGSKTIFGKTGNFEGEDVIAMILERKETAVFITRKIYRFLVNETVDESRVRELAESFHANYDIPQLLRQIVSADWFYAPENIASIIKSPVELIVGLNRTFGIAYENPQPLLAVQRVLGQTLFFPPNVAGWAGGRNWIDNSTLITRLNLPKRLTDASQLDVDVKNDMDDITPNEVERKKSGNTFQCSFNWELFGEKFKEISDDKLWEALCIQLLANTMLLQMPDKLKVQAENSNRAEKIRLMAIYIVRTPDYQLS